MAGPLKMEPHHAHYPAQPPHYLSAAASMTTSPMSSYLLGRESSYHSAAMYSASLHCDPVFGLDNNYYGNMGYGYMSPYYRYVTQYYSGLFYALLFKFLTSYLYFHLQVHEARHECEDRNDL